jgi:hypothetical protein
MTVKFKFKGKDGRKYKLMITSFLKIFKNKSGQEGNIVTVDKRSISSPLRVRRISVPYAELGLPSLVRRALNKVIMKVNTMGIGINMLPYFSVKRYSIRRRAYMQSIIAFVSMQWHAHNWHKTMLGREQGYELGVKWVKQYWLVPRRWDPGDILNCLSLLAPRSGPNRSIADIQYFRVMDLMNSNYDNSLELMLSISYYLGVIAFWEMAPQILLEVDPTLVLQPEKVQILSKEILLQGVQPLDVLDGSICTDNTVHNQITDDFRLRRLRVTEEARAKAGAKALAIAMSAAMMGFMLNAVATSNISI